MIKIKTGDLLRADEKIIAHQVNCFGSAGGLAAHVFKKYPDAESDYHQIIERFHSAGGSRSALLGFPQVTGQQPDGHVIANLFGQFYPGDDYRPDDLREALEGLAGMARIMGWSVAIPWRISCGICGGDWNEVREIINETMAGVDCVIYRREGDE